MNWKKKVFENFRLYAITDLQKEDPEIFGKVEAAYRGGADIVQLRSKTLNDNALYRVGIRFRKIANRFRKLFFVNDRPDLAMAVEADGAHLGQEDLPIKAARRIVRPGGQFIIGRSTHSLAQALQASREGADYIGVGPIFETPTKPGYQPVGLDLIRQLIPLTLLSPPSASSGSAFVRRRAGFGGGGGEGGGEGDKIRIPFVCIGGIDKTNIREVVEAGGSRVAVVRAIFNAPNVYQATQTLRKKLGSSLDIGHC